MADKPLCEHLAKVYQEAFGDALVKRGVLKPEFIVKWDELPPEQKTPHLYAMAETLESLDLLGAHVRLVGNRIQVRAKGEVAQATMPPPQQRTQQHQQQQMSYSQARHMGFTGDQCSNCQSMQMVQNGSCQKCQSCGETTGCS